jgi:ApbE superfamily uncharacterized protein (UPF0280 family)
MTRQPQIAALPGGRLHLQDGPIDLIIRAFGEASQIDAAYRAASARFAGLLDELCAELPRLRAQATPGDLPCRGIVARRMQLAVAPFAAEGFITPMAAVAGSVAEEILSAMTGAALLDRAFVNNGGDIALHLAPGERLRIGMVDRPDRPAMFGNLAITAEDGIAGIATSGRHGRSFSLGMADAVTVLASTASEADAAATVVANAVDLPGHNAVHRMPARDLQPDSDLADRLVTIALDQLAALDVALALDRGTATAESLIEAGLIRAAALHLQGETRVAGGAHTMIGLSMPAFSRTTNQSAGGTAHA